MIQPHTMINIMNIAIYTIMIPYFFSKWHYFKTMNISPFVILSLIFVGIHTGISMLNTYSINLDYFNLGGLAFLMASVFMFSRAFNDCFIKAN